MENGEKISMRSKPKGSLEKNIPYRGKKCMGKFLRFIMPCHFFLHVTCSITEYQNSQAQHIIVILVKW